MSQRTIEERLSALELQVAELRTMLNSQAQDKDWRSTFGMFSGDEVMKRIGEEALKFREADRMKARRRKGKSRQVKS